MDHAPHGHWGTTTLVAALRLDGTTAPLAVEGATDTEMFVIYIQKVLAPGLRPGDLVVMDNLSPHKAPAVAAATRRPGNAYHLNTPSRTAESVQEELTQRYFYDPIFNQRCAVIESRGNPIGYEDGEACTPCRRTAATRRRMRIDGGTPRSCPSITRRTRGRP